jgi:hypothetical protein
LFRNIIGHKLFSDVHVKLGALFIDFVDFELGDATSHLLLWLLFSNFICYPTTNIYHRKRGALDLMITVASWNCTIGILLAVATTMRSIHLLLSQNQSYWDGSKLPLDSVVLLGENVVVAVAKVISPPVS